MRPKIGILFVPLLLAACSPMATPGDMVTQPAERAELLAEVFPGSIFTVRLDRSISGATLGEVTATVIEPLLTESGAVAIPAGAQLKGSALGYHPSVGVIPALVGLDFNRIVVGSEDHLVATRVAHVDVAVADDAATLPAGIVSIVRPETLNLGTVVDDATTFYVENELGYEPLSVISLGWETDGSIPAESRITVEFAPL